MSDSMVTTHQPMRLYGHPKTRSMRIHWLLEELGVEYEFKRVLFSKGGARPIEFLMINPSGKVPALVDEQGRVLLESAAIITYLAERFGQGCWIPPEATYERAVFNQWSYFVLTELEQPLWTIGKHKFALPKEHRVAAVIETAQWEYQQALTLLSDGLKTNRAILGQCGSEWDQFTAVDILICQTLNWGLAFGQPMAQANLIDYVSRHSARPALAAARARESMAEG